MPAYIRGSLALDDRLADLSTVTKKNRVATKKVYRAKALPTAEKLMYLCAVVAFCVMAGFIAFRYTAIFELNSQMVKLESEIRQLEEQNALLKHDVAKLQDPERLIEIGIQLGLSLPDQLPEVGAAAAQSREVAIGSVE